MDTRLSLIQTLMTEFDHAIMSPNEVARYAAAFQVTLPCRVQNPHDLYDSSLHEGKGLGSDELAEALCRHLNVAFTPKIGRGSRLRECCTKLMAHLTTGE